MTCGWFHRAGWGLALLLLSSGSGCASPIRDDPWQPVNRPVFSFNEGLDQYVLEPVAEYWHRLPDAVETGIGNAFENLSTPWTAANNLLQIKPLRTVQDLARFAVNSTTGVAGLFDVASRVGLPAHKEDFGQTLGVWTVPTGPYWVLPFWGPASPRHAVGRMVDTLGNPFFYLRPGWIGVTAGGVELINTRAQYLEIVRDFREGAVDYYVFVRDAYMQTRRSDVRDEVAPAAEDTEDLYYPDEDL